MAKEKKQDSGCSFRRQLEIVKCKEGNKEFMKERPARRPFGNTVLICEYPLDGDAMQEPNARMITWRLAKRAARDFLRVSFMTSAIGNGGEGGQALHRRSGLRQILSRKGLFNMLSKKITCGVCGYRITPKKEEIYVAEEPRAFVDALTKPPTRFNAMDCPRCGCQIMLAVRVDRVNVPERNDADESEVQKMKIKNIAAICKKNKYAVIL